MDWSDLASIVGKSAPVLGSLLGGAPGAMIGGLIASALGTTNTPEAVSTALQNNPDALLKLKQIELDNMVQLQQLSVTAEQNRLAAETANTNVVNSTMQVEAKSDHWATWFWRPAIGLAVAIDVFATSMTISAAYIAVAFFGVKADILSYIPAMIGAMSALIGVTMPVLGIASYFRGKMQADPSVPTDNRG